MMREYVRHQTALLIRRLDAALGQAGQAAGEEAIHDVRVALRRLGRCLQVFAQFYPPGSRKGIRRRIAVLLAAAGAVRDCDVAMELAMRAGVDRRSVLLRQLAVRRRRTGRDLLAEIRRWKTRGVVRKWGKRLGL